MKFVDLKDVIKTPKNETLFPPEEKVVRAYANLRNADKKYTFAAKVAGGYMTEFGDINYPKFENELRYIVANEELSAFVAYQGDNPADQTPVGFVVYGPSSYPDNEFVEYVDANYLPVMVYGMPGDSIQLRQMLFSEELSEQDAKQFFIEALNAAGEKEGVIIEADRENENLINTLHQLGFDRRGIKTYEIGKKIHTTPHFPWEEPYTTQYRETAEVMYAAVETIFENIHSDNVVIHPQAKIKVDSEARLPRSPVKIQEKSK